MAMTFTKETARYFILPILILPLVFQIACGQQPAAGASNSKIQPPRSAAKIPTARHVFIYHQAGRFAGFPANHGIWCWGNEILVGFSAGDYKDLGPNRHAIDREKPEEHLP
jgi:hypothetical protein